LATGASFDANRKPSLGVTGASARGASAIANGVSNPGAAAGALVAATVHRASPTAASASRAAVTRAASRGSRSRRVTLAGRVIEGDLQAVQIPIAPPVFRRVEKTCWQRMQR
jgi:hypothetical protein